MPSTANQIATDKKPDAKQTEKFKRKTEKSFQNYLYSPKNIELKYGEQDAK